MTDDDSQVTRAETMEIEQWLASHVEDGIADDWVPGAELDERRRLAALGGLVAGLIGIGPDASLFPEFSAPQLRQWITHGPTPPEEVISSAKELLASSKRDTVLASLYARAVSPNSRRHLGTFFTNPTIVNWMVDKWVTSQSKPNSVVDVGAGVGIFTTSAAERWPDAQVWAVDINPITLGLLALRVRDDFAVQDLQSSDPGIRLVLDDYVSWIQKTWDSLPAGRLILGNPPYTRLQLLAQNDRARLIDAAGGLCGSRASLSAIMTAATLQLIEPEDGMCLLLPAQWLEADYAVKLRQRIWSLSNRRVELHLFNSTPFANVQVDAVALLIGREESVRAPFILGIGEKSWDHPRDGDAPDSWRSLFEPPRKVKSATSRAKLRDFATVKRGIATGKNEFFIIPETEIKDRGLARSVLRPLVRRLKDLPDVYDDEFVTQIDPSKRFHLLVATKKQVDSLIGLKAYVTQGSLDEINKGTLCQARTDWFDLTPEVSTPDVIVGPMTKKVFRLIENKAGALVTNNLYGLVWKKGTSEQTRADLLTWLRSSTGQTSIKEAARAQGEGLLKIEPKAFNDLALPPRFKPLEDTLL